MDIRFGNVIVKKVRQGKGAGAKSYVTLGDKDAIKEVDFSVQDCNLKEGFVGAVLLSGADIVFMQKGGFITGERLDPVVEPKK